MLVTTSYKPSPRIVEQAGQLAARLGCKTVPRQSMSIARLQAAYRDPDILLVNEQELKFCRNDNTPVYFHPSTSLPRVKRLMKGEGDVLLDVSSAGPGDRIVDCTAGLASDSIVLSFAAGETGSVTAIESEPAICALVEAGLVAYTTELPVFNAAMRRVRMHNGDHLDYLRQLADRSVDIVYFDPMFREPIRHSSSITPLRSVANPSPLKEESIREAVRVARKSIVLKENRDGGEFDRLGFVNVHRSHSKIAYGVIVP